MDQYSCLAIDMGAGSIRIVQGIFGEKLTLHEVYRFDNKIEFNNGHDRWNIEKITSEIIFGINKALKESEIKISSIGIDSWGVDFVLVGKNGKPVEDPISYRDSRTEGMKELWEQFMSQFETFRLTGINYNIFNSLYQLLSLKGSQQLKTTEMILFMASYIGYVLTGKAVNELSLAATSQMLDCKNLKWDPDILEYLGLQHKYPGQPVRVGFSLGRYKLVSDYEPEVITVAGHDTASAVAAIPFESENCAFISTGTWCIIGVLSEIAYIDRESFEAGITNEITADGKFRPSKNLMGLWLLQQLRISFGSKNNFREIDEMASVVASNGITIDTFDPLFFNPYCMKKAFDECLERKYNLKLKTEGEYYRCAYDSLVKSFHENLQLFERLNGKPFDCIHITGGGSQSEFLCRLLANKFKINVVAGPVEGATVGNIILQARSNGFINSDSEIKSIINKSFEVKVYKPKNDFD
jgi:rhamnulokinase